MNIELSKEKCLPLIWYYYPFSKEEIGEFQDIINWKMLSNNTSMKWSYDLIKNYYDLWDWKALDDNGSVFKAMTLHLLFPDKVEPINCDCYRKLDYCDCITESTNWKSRAIQRADDFINFIYSEHSENLRYLKAFPRYSISKEQLKIILNLKETEKVIIHLD